MSRSHNKKRNTGLMYEFLVRSISNCLVEGNQKDSSSALKIIRKYFKPGTELYREFRLINSLVRTTVTSEHVANSILQEAKLAARQYNMSALEHEKSLLIKAINYGINDPHFYDQQIDEYKMYATVQQLINDWRNPNCDLARQAQYEDQLMHWLLEEKFQSKEQPMLSESAGTNRLLMKIMMQKLNEKYSSILNDKQKDLIKTYAWATTNDDDNLVKDKLSEIKDLLLNSINSFVDENSSNKYVIEQLDNAKAKLLSETLEVVNDETLTRFMLYLKLSDELLSNN